MHRYAAVLATAALTALLAARLPAAAAPPRSAGVVPDAKAHGRLYVSDYLNGEILAFPASEHAANAPPLQTIDLHGATPQGLWVDRTGTLYAVVNTSVEAFHPGAATPFLTITQGLEHPVSVAVDANLTVYVNDEERTSLAILEYPEGSTSPALDIPLSVAGTSFSFAGGLALDRAGNLYVSAFFYPKPPAHVYRIPPGSTTATDLGLSDVGNSAGLGVDGHGNLFVGDQESNIGVYPPGATSPARTITVGSIGSPLFAVTASGALYVPFQRYNSGSVEEFAPRAGSPSNVLTGTWFGQPYGAALEREDL
jgi:hypothetical protein